MSPIQSIADLKTYFPSLTIVDSASWREIVDCEKHQLAFDDTPSLNYEEITTKLRDLFDNKVEFKKTLFRRVPLQNPGLQETGGATLLLLPRGLSLIKIGHIGQNFFESFHLNLLEVNKDEVDGLLHSRWVLITDSIAHTHKISQKASLKLLENMNYTLPTLLPLLSLELLNRKKNLNPTPNKVRTQLIKFTQGDSQADRIRAFCVGRLPGGRIVFSSVLIHKRYRSIPVSGAWYP